MSSDLAKLKGIVNDLEFVILRSRERSSEELTQALMVCQRTAGIAANLLFHEIKELVEVVEK